MFSLINFWLGFILFIGGGTVLVLATGLVRIGERQVGVVIKKYGPSLKAGQLIALDGGVGDK